MPPVRFRGPICQTQDWYDTILDGTLARMPTPSPATIGSPATEDASEQHPPAQASGACSFLNSGKPVEQRGGGAGMAGHHHRG